MITPTGANKFIADETRHYEKQLFWKKIKCLREWTHSLDKNSEWPRYQLGITNLGRKMGIKMWIPWNYKLIDKQGTVSTVHRYVIDNNGIKHVLKKIKKKYRNERVHMLGNRGWIIRQHGFVCWNLKRINEENDRMNGELTESHQRNRLIENYAKKHSSNDGAIVHYLKKAKG